METPTTQNYIVYPSVNRLASAQAVSGTNQIHPPVNESSWHLNSATSTQTSLMFSVTNRAPDLDYPSPAPSTASPPYSHPHQQAGHYSIHNQSPTIHNDTSNNTMLPQFTQVESSIGPSRVLTRRQRAALEQGTMGRRVSMSSTFHKQDQGPTSTPRHSSAIYPTPPIGTSRPQTPRNGQSGEFQSQRDRVSLNMASALPLQMQSPTYPMTPTSMTSSFSPYAMYSHSRSASDSHSNNQRSASPALSNVSALTSVSSLASGPVTQTFPPYPHPSCHVKMANARKPKQRKQRLTNVDRKEICTHHLNFPNARQEDIATKFGVERSTISKILKYKQKWLSMPEHEGSRISKQRPSKFPQIEEELIVWLEERSRSKTAITDNSIREKAKEIAKKLHITEEKFKASSGWIENFKTRHGIRSGIWMGTGRRSHATATLSDDHTGGSVLSPLNPAFDGQLQDSSHMDIHDDGDLESEGSPEPEHGEDQPDDHHMTEAVNIQASWPDHNNDTSSNHPATHPPSTSHRSIDQNIQHQSNSIPHISPLDQAPDVGYVDSAPAYYQPPVLEPRAPTLQDAEEAINTLITFIDTSGRGILEDGERQTLTTIKCALFQAASGIPFDRDRR